MQKTNYFCPSALHLQLGGSELVDWRAGAMGRWRWLLLLLLLGGMVEAALAGESLAQPRGKATVEQEAQEATAPAITAPAAITVPATTGPISEPMGESASVPASESTTEPPAIAPQQSESSSPEAIVIPMPQATPDSRLDAVTPNAATRIYLIDNQVSFVPPPGFTAMSPAEIEVSFSKERPPVQVYANAERDVSVGITVSEISLDPEQLPEVRAILEDSLESAFSGFEWLENDFVNLDGQDWIKLEFLSRAAGQQIHNDMYITILKGRLLGFNFNANLAADPALRSLLQDSRNSISLSPKANKNED